MPRRYELRQRAAQKEATRQRIVEATVGLHEVVGGAGATISAIAQRAGVSRATVLRHFPDERALLAACTSHYASANPLPDPGEWDGKVDPVSRLESALGAIYAYHRRTEAMSDRAERDVREMPVLRELLEPARAYWDGIRASLAASWQVPATRRPLVDAAIGHALGFGTWQSLVREQGLDDAQATEVMLAMVTSVARERAVGSESPLRPKMSPTI